MVLLPDDRMGWSIRLLLGTGMRTQELLALEPRHIEPDGSCIHIRQAINMIKGTAVISTPKSRDSYRDVPVPESIREYAVKLRTTETKFIWEMKKKDSSHIKSFSTCVTCLAITYSPLWLLPPPTSFWLPRGS